MSRTSPPAPPKATTLIVELPEVFPDGGRAAGGCNVTAHSSNEKDKPGTFTNAGALCTQAISRGDQALANANGWNDGGTP